MCYCETANCNLTCGHSFCFACVKEWYHKCSEPTCPMCRQTLNFKGLHRLEEKWSEEARYQQVDELFSEFIDEVLDECDWPEFAMTVIDDAQKRLHLMYGAEWEFDKELFEGILYGAIDLTTTTPPREYDEPKTFEHTLFTPKSPIRRENPHSAARNREFSAAARVVFDILIVV